MSKVVIRSLFLLLLLISILGVREAVKIRNTFRYDVDIAVSVKDVIRDRGLALHENPIRAPNLRSAVIYFQRPECREVSVVIPFDLNHGSLPFLASVIKPDFDRRFIYLDGSWKEQDRVSMFIEWVKHRVLGVFGASPYFPNRTAIVLAEPSDCRPAVAIDWRLVWDIDRYRNAKRAKQVGIPGRVEG